MPDETNDTTPPADAREDEHEVEAASDEAGVGVGAGDTDPGDHVVEHESAGQRVLYVSRDQWLERAEALRRDGFEMCVDICAVDHLLNRGRPVPDGVTPERYEIVANFLSMSRNERVRLIAQVPGDDPRIASLTPVYPGVDYSERETYDLFGIVFEGHPDLTRILLPEDWEGHPLRKDDAAARVPVQFKGTATTPDQQSLGRQA